MNFQQSYLYWLAGAVLLIVALMSWQDKANPRRFTTGLFWGIYGVLFLLGDWTYSLFGDKRAVHIAGFEDLHRRFDSQLGQALDPQANVRNTVLIDLVAEIE